MSIPTSNIGASNAAGRTFGNAFLLVNCVCNKTSDSNESKLVGWSLYHFTGYLKGTR